MPVKIHCVTIRVLYTFKKDDAHQNRLPDYTDLNKFWLDGGGVNALVVEKVLDRSSDAHVLPHSASDVGRQHDAVSGQLPYMELVDTLHALHL